MNENISLRQRVFSTVIGQGDIASEIWVSDNHMIEHSDAFPEEPFYFLHSCVFYMKDSVFTEHTSFKTNYTQLRFDSQCKVSSYSKVIWN